MIGSGQSGPTTRDGAAVHWNPANLAYMKKGEFFGGLMLVAGDIRYQRNYRGTYQTPDTLEFKTPIDPSENIDSTKVGYGPGQGQPDRPARQHLHRPPADQEPPRVRPRRLRALRRPAQVPRNGPQAWQLQQAFIVASQHHRQRRRARQRLRLVGAGVSYVLGFAELAKLQDFGSVQEFGDGPQEARPEPTTSAPTPPPRSASSTPYRARSPSRRPSRTASPSTSASPSTRPRSSASP
jgi:long-chain fatty acid transport protein